jgi:hypothetical protein
MGRVPTAWDRIRANGELPRSRALQQPGGGRARSSARAWVADGSACSSARPKKAAHAPALPPPERNQ